MFFGEYSYEEDIAAQREEAKEEGLEQGIQQGAQQQAIETALNMLKKKKYSVDEIVEITDLTPERVLELQAQVIK